jgi:hypothetical protein
MSDEATAPAASGALAADPRRAANLANLAKARAAKKANPPPAHRPPKTKVPAAPRTARPAAEFAGMTATECCADCRTDRCVITGIGICGHPMKGGLQAPLMVRPDVVERYGRARKTLAHVRIDKLP